MSSSNAITRVKSITYNYLTQNGKVVRQTWTEGTDAQNLDCIYDNSERPYALVYTNSTGTAVYYYILNQQGDVIRILGPNNTVAATYTYNAWGEVISSSGWMAEQNPIRYRGYFQDNETGFYYLQSRYYDPSIGRFINADTIASTGQGFIGHNMFAYCLNSPVIMGDDGGTDAYILIDYQGAILWAHIGFIAQASDGSWWHFFWGPQKIIKFLNAPNGAKCTEYEGRVDLDSINSSGIYSTSLTYDEMFRIEGDFSKSIEKAIEYGNNNNYDLITNNCSKVSFSLLSEGTSESTDMLKFASGYLQPSDAYWYASNSYNYSTPIRKPSSNNKGGSNALLV